MEEMDKKNRNRHEETIITLVKQKDTSLAKLRKKTSRQAVLYHIPKLCKENLIRVYVKGSGVKDEEIFYTFVNRYDYPQDFLKLIKSMCDADTNKAFQNMVEFMGLCVERNVDDAQKKAYLIMAGVMPELEIAQLVYHITYLWKQPQVKEY